MSLREDNEHKGHKYLCSNPNCRKVFSRPKIIKYQVCPACQTLVDIVETKNKDKILTSFASKKSLKLKKKKKVKTGNSEGLTLEAQPASVEPPPEEPLVPEKKPEGSEETSSFVQVQMPQQGKVEMPPVQQTKTLEGENFSKSLKCQYGFGYLYQRKKGEDIPDTCIECPKLLNCMLSDQCEKEESVAEIMKWYTT